MSRIGAAETTDSDQFLTGSGRGTTPPRRKSTLRTQSAETGPPRTLASRMQRMQRMKQTYTEQRAAEKSAGRVASPGGFAGSARKRNSSMSRIRQTSERELAPSAEAVRDHHANSDTAATCQNPNECGQCRTGNNCKAGQTCGC